MFYGLLDIPWWGYILYTLLFTHVTIVCVTLFLHRCQAHRSLDVHPILGHFFRFWLWVGTGMVTKAWAAIHRKHHAKCETPEDPHSPQVEGIHAVLWTGTELYRKEARNPETLEKYGKGTPDDWIERHIYTPHSALGVFLLLGLELLLFGVPGLAIWAVQMSWIPFFAAGVINGLGHFWGYRNFECDDASTNLSPIGILIGGEELHNNHHTYPTSAKFSIKMWEFDIGWFYIKLFSLFGLAKVKRVAPKPKLVPGKSQVDMETVKAVINNRFQVMTRYSKKVLLPAIKEELNDVKVTQLGKSYNIKQMLLNEANTMDAATQEFLDDLLAKHNGINQVYQLRGKLAAIWAQTTLKEKELIEALRRWCQEAESTGQKALKDFAGYIRSYALTPSVMPS